MTEKFPRRRFPWLGAALAVLGLFTAVVLLGMDDRASGLLENSLFLAGMTCLFSLPLGTVLAWLLVRTDLPLRKPVLVLFGLMLFVPLYLQAAAWQAGFGIQGWYTMAYNVPLWLDGWTAAILVHTMVALPWVMLIVGAGFWLVEPELEEQALLDASAARVFLRVTLPATSTAIAVAGLWVLIITAGEMTATDLFGVRNYAEEVYTRLAVGPQPGDLPLGVMPGTVFTVWLVVAGLALLATVVPGERPISVRKRVVFRLGSWRWPIAVLTGIVILLVVGVPLASLCYKAGVLVTQTDLGRVRHWSLAKCVQMAVASPARYGREFGWSLAIGALAATTSTAAGIVLAWIARRGGIRAMVVLAIVAVCVAVPGPIVGLGVIWLLNRPHPVFIYLYDDSIVAPWLALSIRSLAPATLVLWHALRTVPPAMLDSAAVDGAGPVARLCRIALPCRLWALALAWLVAMAIAFGDLAASVLVVPPGVTTLSIRIFGLLHYGVEDRVAGICLMLVAVFAITSVGALWFTKRWSQEAS